MSSMTVSSMTVSSMHEEVHEDAAERQQVEQRAKHMGAVLGEEQEPADRKEAKQDKACPGRQKRALRLVVVRMVVH
jgi:hypothetical protein